MTKSDAAWLASASPEQIEAFFDGLSENAVAALPWLFEFWAWQGHQQPPQGDWSTWVILGGRGAGKTRAGAEWVRSQAEGPTPLAAGAARRIALVAETADQARDVMVLGDSGLIACSPPDRRPTFHVSRRRLTWPNGAEAQLYSAKDPESLRGPQFDCAWSDELGKWRRVREGWDMLQFGLRLGDRPRQIVTTTPRRNKVLVEILQDPATAVTTAPTEVNRANLARDFFTKITRRYEGTSLGRQELGGELMLEVENALWTRARIERARAAEAPALTRIVVGVDPPVSGRRSSDECGIIVAGLHADGAAVDWKGYVIADFSVGGVSPQAWAERAVAAYHSHRADRLVAEVNQGGDMVEAIVRTVDPTVSFKAVHASRAKVTRAEPIAALYEQGRVLHAGLFPELEDQMCEFSRDGLQSLTRRSPDRVDALVWALTELMLDKPVAAPRVRRLD